MTSVDLDSSDRPQVERVLEAHFGTRRLSVAQHAPTLLRLRRDVVGTMAVDSADYGTGFEFTMEPPEHILLCRVVAGGVEHRGAARPTTSIAVGQSGVIGNFGAGDADGPLKGRVQPGQIDHVLLDPRRLSAHAAPSADSDGPVRLTGPSPVSPAACRLLTMTVEYVKCCAAQRIAERNPLLAATLEHHVATVLLATLPNTAVVEPTSEERHDSTPAMLRKATSFIDDNAHRDIALSDIAAAIYATIRTVQYLFRKHLDCTPTEYLRRVRLHHVRVDLAACDRNTTTVAQIARSWGFRHLGRFAAYYREQYGESPHVTLRR